MSEVSKECQICGSAGPHQILPVREMYFGSRELFEYFCCVACDSLQIINALEGEALAHFYPADYYSYNVPDQPQLLRWLTAQQDRFELQVTRSLLSRVVGAFISKLPPGVRGFIGTRDSSGDVIRMLSALNLGSGARILDVGCGGGALLDRLARVGYTNLSGVDPFVEADVKTALGVPILKRDLGQVTGEFDLIMFNHSLEHVPDFVPTLRAAHKKLAEGGSCLARVPTTSSEAWRIYGTDWCLIDAPQHVVIPSRNGMELAADAAGFRVNQTFDDSNSAQFFGSEAHQRDIAATELKSLWHLVRLFGLKQLYDWERRSERLNRQSLGDMVGFVLRSK
ncbi:class I SAM-dependent methyltransferase [Mycolicibacterium tusciae]|uniref:class I SAM-dependent methyltransferase n=1 Tax=Mycolicibacterium tusciae TaxID=75922 RepID=UPI00024A1EED|nr:class I SAM-dependent methyltransferase [Mycolicibacterium tusciae]